VHLERLDEGPEQSTNAFTSTEQLDNAHHSEQTKEVDTDDCRPARLHQQQQQQQQPVYNRLYVVVCAMCYAQTMTKKIVIFHFYKKE